jgi:hypothetical protein
MWAKQEVMLEVRLKHLRFEVVLWDLRVQMMVMLVPL